MRDGWGGREEKATDARGLLSEGFCNWVSRLGRSLRVREGGERRDTIGSGGHALAKPHLTQLAHHIEGRGHALIRQGEETGVIGFEGGRGSAPHKLRNNLSTGASLLVDAEKLLRVLQLQHLSSQ